MPTFASLRDRQLAQQLMQPVLIRVIDNIRKQLDASDWSGSYQDQVVWPATATPDQQRRYLALQSLLETAAPPDRDPIQQALDQLPQPQHRYTLCLQRANQQQQIDLWQLCYRVCRQNSADAPIQVDPTLIDPDTRSVDWIRLDEKAQILVSEIFQNLP